MVKFARDIISKMVNLTRDLADVLGNDTADLQMRVGLHSGNVIAGVLRGKKSRFQLFGDTMNTAARMESNGMPGKIHVSEATADELGVRGKGHWVSPREDTIVAKGKGELHTYWVSVQQPPKSIIAMKQHNEPEHPSHSCPLSAATTLTDGSSSSGTL
jgi:class 3 adenylate cyclase